MTVHIFLPCRKGSERIPNKNTKDFAGIKGGLLKVKLDQLTSIKNLESIVISSNDELVLEFAKTYSDSRILIDERPDHLGSSTTTTDELIKYVPSIIDEGHVLWTHVTSPFINANDYEKIIQCYFDKLDIGYDSLMSVLKLQGFIWDECRPVSYQRDTLNWPLTQNIKPLYEVDSGVFLSSIANYRSLNDRIGKNVFLYQQDKNKAVDIDWPEDFSFAEFLWNYNNIVT